MSHFRPNSNEKPNKQSSKTPSGKKIPMAMSMMVDSMVRMIQKASKQNTDLLPKESTEN
tara:strand:- start:378 stop:554 length:177 start_codon:yes stop_codon:yes gene_type:complete